MNVAVDLYGFDGWLGGIDFVKAYMNALYKIKGYNVFVFIQKKDNSKTCKKLYKIPSRPL